MSERIPPHVDSGVAALLAEAPAGGVVKRSVTIAGHRTSVSLEAPFWDALQAIAKSERTTVTALVTAVDSRRDQMAGNLSSALRVFCLRWTQSKAGTIA